MIKPDPAVMEFLLTRRSRPYKTLTTPVPDRQDLMPLLTIAGFIHIGTQTCIPPERPRPNLETITEWVSA